MSLNNQIPMPIVEVPQGSSATVVVVSLQDVNGAAVDISAATGALLFNIWTIERTAVVTDGTATFTTDGTDGKLSLPMSTAIVATARDLYSDVEVQGYSGGNLVGFKFILRIVPRAKVV